MRRMMRWIEDRLRWLLRFWQAKPVAFLDVDGTLWNGNCSVEAAEFLAPE